MLNCMLELQVLFLQNIDDGGQPITTFNLLDQSCEFFGNLDIPNYYNKNEVDSLIANTNLSNYCNKAELDSILATHSYASISFTLRTK